MARSVIRVTRGVFYAPCWAIADEKCSKCIPDCSNTIYEPMITTVPFRKCDESNLGVSWLCNIDNTKLPNPTKFAQQVTYNFSYTI